MTSRIFVVFSLLAGSAVAQIGTGSVNLTPSGHPQLVVQVKPSDLDRPYGVSASTLVSTSDLAVPSRARKELNKANEFIAKQDLAQAVQRLKRAIAIDPTYAVAYNNLGVIYSRLGDPAREQEALQKAIGLDDHFALAYVNLGRMDIAASDFPDAESALDKASACDPTDPVALILLSYVELMQQRFDNVIATAGKAHALEKPHAFVHRVAARAFEQQRQGANAIAELEMFLKEEPQNPRADAVRQELQIVTALLQ